MISLNVQLDHLTSGITAYPVDAGMGCFPDWTYQHPISVLGNPHDVVLTVPDGM
jgi:hypothetical protein